MPKPPMGVYFQRSRNTPYALLSTLKTFHWIVRPYRNITKVYESVLASTTHFINAFYPCQIKRTPRRTHPRALDRPRCLSSTTLPAPKGECSFIASYRTRCLGNVYANLRDGGILICNGTPVYSNTTRTRRIEPCGNPNTVLEGFRRPTTQRKPYRSTCHHRMPRSLDIFATP